MKIKNCKKIDLNTSKNLVITCFLHISPIKSINHNPPPWYSQYFSTFCHSREFPGNDQEFPGIPDSREWKFCSRKFIPSWGPLTLWWAHQWSESVYENFRSHQGFYYGPKSWHWIFCVLSSLTFEYPSIKKFTHLELEKP